MDSNDMYHAQTGAPHIKMGQPLLRDDPALWASVWAEAREPLLADWIEKHPGSRPPAWHRFDAAGVVPLPDESEVEMLDRLNLLSDGELAAIVTRVKQLADFNVGRSPIPTSAGYYVDMFIPPDELAVFCCNHGLLSPLDRANLGLEP